MPEKLAICLLASEVEPLSKTGGLGDVSGALTRYLYGAGHDVRLFTPCYASIDRAAYAAQPLAALQQVPLALGPNKYVFSVLRAQLPGGAPAYLIDCPALYARTGLYTSDPDEHLRFLAFTRAALTACQRLGWAPQVLHCNDWHTAFAPLFLRTAWQDEPLFAATRTVLTIHNIGYQGIFPAARIADLGLPGRRNLLHQPDLAAGRINALRHGILYADSITTVSPTHAREICSDEYGMGLQDSLRERRHAVTGILNGVDYEEWDPRHDRYLPAHYDPERLAVKGELKRQFARRHRLAAASKVPLAGVVSRLAVQKGIELMFEALPKTLSARPLAFVALGNGEPQYEEFFTALERRFPGRVVFHYGYDEELAHWIEAASDLFLMPSRYEPCGLNQMYSLRYGTVPVVRRTGGLADSVQHYDTRTGTGTGVVFNDFNAQALEWALNTALDLYATPRHWTRVVRNGMQQDFSWERQAGEYVALYRRLIAG
ncbi:MAG: glycogen synthase [Gammaproteobacteria bacterium]|nr:MAG: glycogen synthase [Gammaproteobacteria bacterium]TLY88167.1 MAG: glycogen synthase [Gammaproteobacteria bacterium]